MPRAHPLVSPVRALLIVLAIWAAIYLPRLGSIEIRGEEGRRILPATRMLETGNFVVPYIGSEPYLNKPPLINWLIGGSFKLCGRQDEFAARLPSGFAVLAAALVLLFVPARTSSTNARFASAIIWLSALGTMDKGRLAEIEALYMSLTGIAFVCWISFWRERRSRWSLWLVPAVFLGFGLLTKGPTHLVFFYSIVLAVLWQEHALRELWSLAHLAGVALMLAIFAAWAVPYVNALEAARVASVWSQQLGDRVVSDTFNAARWAWNIPDGIWYFLPWALLLPLVRLRRVEDERTRRLLKGTAWGMAASFLIVSMLPASLSRYTMPLLLPACWFLAMCVEHGALIALRNAHRWVLVVAALISVGAVCYAMFVVPGLRESETVRPNGTRINALVSAPERLYAIDPYFQPYLFYVRAPVVYVTDTSALPPDARYVLARTTGGTKPEQARRELEARNARKILDLDDKRGHRAAVYELAPSTPAESQ
ncbi:MAG TPA: glycosyltransferase family 39 protein [Chthoniobacterales bacterium]